MPQLELFQIPSPCIGLCQNGPNGYCYGCFRSRDERFGWTKLGDEHKRHVIKLCQMRKRRWLAKKLELKQINNLEEQGVVSPENEPTLDLFSEPKK